MVPIRNQYQDEQLQDKQTVGNDEIHSDIAIEFGLKFVRADRKRRVYTEHPDSIHPRRLQAFLLHKFKRDHLKVLLLGNVYIIYIDREAVDSDSVRNAYLLSMIGTNCKIGK